MRDTPVIALMMLLTCGVTACGQAEPDSPPPAARPAAAPDPDAPPPGSQAAEAIGADEAAPVTRP